MDGRREDRGAQRRAEGLPMSRSVSGRVSRAELIRRQIVAGEEEEEEWMERDDVAGGGMAGYRQGGQHVGGTRREDTRDSTPSSSGFSFLGRSSRSSLRGGAGSGREEGLTSRRTHDGEGSSGFDAPVRYSRSGYTRSSADDGGGVGEVGLGQGRGRRRGFGGDDRRFDNDNDHDVGLYERSGTRSWSSQRRRGQDDSHPGSRGDVRPSYNYGMDARGRHGGGRGVGDEDDEDLEGGVGQSSEAEGVGVGENPPRSSLFGRLFDKGAPRDGTRRSIVNLLSPSRFTRRAEQDGTRDGGSTSMFENEDELLKPTRLRRSNVAAVCTDRADVNTTFGIISGSRSDRLNPKIRDHDEMCSASREKVVMLNRQRRKLQGEGLALPKTGGLAVASLGKLASRLEDEDDHKLYSAADRAVTSALVETIGTSSSAIGTSLARVKSVDGSEEGNVVDAAEGNRDSGADLEADLRPHMASRKALIEKGAILARLAEDPLQAVESLRPPRRPIVVCETIRTFSTGFMVEKSSEKDSDPYQLFVETGRMVLAVHPLMIREEWLGSRLLMAFREHSRRESSRLEEFYTEKYCAVVSAMIRLLDGRTGDAVRFQELLTEAKDYAERAEAEEEAYLMRVEYLEEMYRDIEACRAQQQFKATSIVLIMESEPVPRTDKREGICKLAKELMAELKHLAAMEAPAARTRAETSGDHGGGDDDDDQCTGPAAVLNETPLTLSLGARRRPVLARDTNSDEATTLPLEEVQRRRQISRTHVWTRLVINGRYAGKSQPITLRRDFTVPLHFSFPVQVLSWPSSVSLQLWERRGAALPASMLAEVPIPLPGTEDSSTYYPFVELHFTSESPFTPSWADTEREQAVFVSGEVHIQCSWGAPRQFALQDQDEIEEGYRMPPRPDRAMQSSRGALSSQVRLAQASQAISVRSNREKKNGLEKEESLMSKMLSRAHGVDGTVGFVSGFQMRQWMQGYGFDPNDPRNADLIELMRRNKEYFYAVYSSHDVFRVPPYRLATIEGIALEMGRQRKRRYELLKIRWEQELTSSVEVPLLESLMDETSISSKELKKSVKELKAGKDKKVHSTNAAFAAEKVVEERIGAIEAFEQRVFDTVMDTIRRERGAAALPGNAGMPISGIKRSGAVNSSLRSTEDIVKDVPIPNLLLDTTAISEFFAPRRGLKPRPLRKTETTHPSKCMIHVNVLRGFNLPVREAGARDSLAYDDRRGGGGGSRRRIEAYDGFQEDDGYMPRRRLERTQNVIDTERGLSMRSDLTQSRDFMRQLNFEPEPENREAEQLCPFVEVKLQDSVARTRTVEGTHISFNEQLSLPFKPSNMDFSPSNLLYNDEMITINVFDEVVEEDERQIAGSRKDPRLGQSSRSLNRRFYLGSVRISTSCVYRMGCIQGKFRLDVPPVLIGFQKQSAGLPHISLYISLEPSLAVPFPLTAPMSTLGTTEDELMEMAIKWQADVLATERCKRRHVHALVSDSKGRTCLVTKFVTPLEPPSSITERRLGETLLTVLHRFVSLIPMVEDTLLQRQNKIWATCSETIEMACGDYVEHALLLANYFLSAGVDAYVLLGSGIQQSEMSYVLTFHDGVEHQRLVRLWNPTSGHTFINNDTGCDLISVGMIFNGRNIWANVQEKGEPWNISFDLDDIRHWRPIFDHVLSGSGTVPDASAEAALPVALGSAVATDAGGAESVNASMQEARLMKRDSVIGSIQSQPVYKELPKEFYDDLEAQVEREALDAILEARLPLYTHQNTRCRRILRSLGKELEKAHLSIENAYQMTPQMQQTTHVGGVVVTHAPKAPGAMAGLSSSFLRPMANVLASQAPDRGTAGVDPISSSRSFDNRASVEDANNETSNRLSLLHSHHRKTLLPVSRTSNMAAFQLQTRFADADQVRDIVLNSGVHLDCTDTSEFVVSAHVESYGVAYICAVWIYIAIIYK